MPLKAKITNPAFSTRAPKTARQAGPEMIKEQPGDDPDDVLFNSHYGVRTIELNRPKKLNSLNASMARKIIPRLLEWQKSDMANIILISGAGPKAFCAGGDVAALIQQKMNGPEGRRQSHAYFGLEYQLNHVIATYPKPYIAYLDGITMGGGVGLSVHAPIRIATERTVFAMPETTIGFFPDVGGSFFLPRLEGRLGTYLALTSERLRGVNAFYAGVATHYIDSSILPSLTARLAELQFKDYEDLPTRLSTIDATIAEFDTGLPHEEPMLLAGELRRAIDRCFKPSSVEGIMTALSQESKRDAASDPADMRSWATRTLQTLSERSPTSLRVALRQMQQGLGWSINETFEREYSLAGKFLEHPDFTEGVSARLIRKPATAPVWNPPSLEGVSEEDISEMLQPPPGEEKLQLLKTARGGYREYPYQMGLPREETVEGFVRQGGKKRSEVVQHFLKEKNQRLGVREKVEEVLDRCCTEEEAGLLVWMSEEEEGLDAMVAQEDF
ncbi:MAG: hypothetical protein Q9163_002301 [Psora crenata]